MYDGIKKGLRPLGSKAANKTEEDATLKILHDVMQQAKANNEQLIRQVDHLMQAHADIAKVLLEVFKEMHGMM
ncbi:hypothetical protein ACOJUR_11925 [Alicyclobacillus tolerans]